MVLHGSTEPLFFNMLVIWTHLICIHIYSAWIDLLWTLIWTICSIWQQNYVFVIVISFLYLPIFGKMNFKCHFSCLGWANLMKLLGWNECKLQSAKNMKWIDSCVVLSLITTHLALQMFPIAIMLMCVSFVSVLLLIFFQRAACR